MSLRMNAHSHGGMISTLWCEDKRKVCRPERTPQVEIARRHAAPTNGNSSKSGASDQIRPQGRGSRAPNLSKAVFDSERALLASETLPRSARRVAADAWGLSERFWWGGGREKGGRGETALMDEMGREARGFAMHGLRARSASSESGSVAGVWARLSRRSRIDDLARRLTSSTRWGAAVGDDGAGRAVGVARATEVIDVAPG